MVHWTPTGIEPTDYDDDHNDKYFIRFRCWCIL